jgi:hypothetical protein
MPALVLPSHFLVEIAASAGTSLLPLPATITVLSSALVVIVFRFGRQYVPENAFAVLLNELNRFEKDFRGKNERGLLVDPGFVDSIDLALIEYVALLNSASP